MNKNIIIIEDDDILQKLLSFQILNFFDNNCNITLFKKKQIDQILNQNKIDLLLVNYLDVYNNLKFLREVEQKKTKNIIIIFNNLDNRHENKNLINFKFVVKPFTLKNLFSIISEFFSDFALKETIINLTPDLIFKPNKKFITNEKTKDFIYLTEKETKLLKCLFENKNKVILKKKLLHNVWDFNEGINTHTLETHIYRLKKKIYKIENEINFSFLNKGGGYTMEYK